MDNKKICKEGSYTIELSLLTPIIIAVLLLILFSAYYVHDRVIIEKNSYVSVLRAALCTDVEKREQIAADSFDMGIEGRLLGKWDLERDVSVNSESVTIHIFGAMQMNEGLLQKRIMNKAFSYESENTSITSDETRFLRAFTKSSKHK